MKKLDKIKIGIALCGSFCMYESVFEQIQNIIDNGAEVFPIMSFNSSSMNTRFGKAEDFKKKLTNLTSHEIIDTIQKAEPIGPKNIIDILLIAPCTGNTLSKITYGITDTPVLMACKSHLRNNKPVVIAVSTNDGLGINMRNIGLLINIKNIYFVPFEQDNYISKPNSLVSKMDMIIPTVSSAINGKQLQPVIYQKSN